MSRQEWTLLDVDEGVYLDSFDYREGMASVSKRRLRGGTSDGVDVVEVDNGRLRLTVLPTRGMGIWRGCCGDVELKWNSPNFGPVHPSLVPMNDAGGLGWLEGFDEWLVRCGLESNGSPEFDEQGRLRYGLHGRIANTPARKVTLSVDRESGEIRLTGKVYETKLFFKKLELESTLILHPGSTRFTVRDTVTNLSDHPGDFELLYHINTGLPFAAPGARLVIPFDLMAPRSPMAAQNLPEWDKIGPQTPLSEEVVFFFVPAVDSNGAYKTMLVNPQGDRGIALSFRRDEFPYFSFWKSRLSDADGYVCGLEPAVNFPNPKCFEKKHGRVVPLAPRESRSHDLEFEILQDAKAVQKREREIHETPSKGVIDKAPRKEWTP